MLKASIQNISVQEKRRMAKGRFTGNSFTGISMNRRSPKKHLRRKHFRTGILVKQHFVGKNNSRELKSVVETIRASELQQKRLKVGSVIQDVGGITHRIARIRPVGVADLQEVLFVSRGY